MIRIVHLSDIHFNFKELDNFKRCILNSLILDLKKHNDKKNIDIIVFSGDLIDKGGHEFGSIDEAFREFENILINEISNSIEIDKFKIFFAPGNHDIDRNKDKKINEAGVKCSLTNETDTNKFIEEDDGEGYKRIIPFKEFERNYYSGYPLQNNITNFNSSYVANINDCNIGISCFNSAWRCYDSDKDKGNIIVGEKQFSQSREIIEECGIKIAVMHHSTDWLIDFEKQRIKDCFHKDYDILLLGHIHESDMWLNTNMHGSLVVSVAPSNWTENFNNDSIKHCNGYSIIDYDQSNCVVRMYHRKYSDVKNSYVCNSDLGNVEDEDGVTIINLPAPNEVVRRRNIIDKVNEIYSIYANEKDEHLLSYYTNTVAPKTINDIFVMPDIVENEEQNVEDTEKQKRYSIEEICTSNENQLIFGVQESGKTILLDKIFIELLNNFPKYNKIPVCIDFDTIHTSTIETKILQFVHVNKLELQDFLHDQKIIILIDNIDFNKSTNKNKLVKLQRFIEKYSNIQCIVTGNLSLSGEIPLVELVKYKELSKFKVLMIKMFKSKQIRELTEKWFINNEEIIEDEKVDKLIDIFHSFNLPSTPLAVSMFLWIIEQQENYIPINNAVMLENFVERLFEKSCKKEFNSDTFDYTNKVSLLSKLAYRMYTSDEINYSLSYKEFTDFVYEHLKSRNFDDFNHLELVEYFLAVGVLIKEKSNIEEIIRFRFSCIFKYFLMKYMQSDEIFKTYVLQKDNYLNFIDEIDYYTGISRVESSILREIVDRMYNEYEDIISKVENEDYNFDAYFETKSCITSKLDRKYIKEVCSDVKLDKKDKDIVQDTVLNEINVENKVEKKSEIKPLQKLEKIWIIAAKVLKNTEESTEEGLKEESLRKIIKCSMAFSIIYKFILKQMLESGIEINEEFRSVLELHTTILPYLHQSLLYSLLGTIKLAPLMRREIEDIINKDGKSDLEKYNLVFLYADMNGRDFDKYISRFVTNIKRNYVIDMTLFKILSYYYTKSKCEADSNKYEQILWKLHEKSLVNTKRYIDKRMLQQEKNQIIKKYKAKKNEVLKKLEDI